MKLVISKDYDKSFTEDTSCLATHMLVLPATHLYIASHMWDSITLDITDDIPKGVLGNLNLVCKSIKIKLPEVVTDYTLQLLLELFPDKAGSLRRAYMSGSSISEVLRECLV